MRGRPQEPNHDHSFISDPRARQVCCHGNKWRRSTAGSATNHKRGAHRAGHVVLDLMQDDLAATKLRALPLTGEQMCGNFLEHLVSQLRRRAGSNSACDMLFHLSGEILTESVDVLRMLGARTWVDASIAPLHVVGPDVGLVHSPRQGLVSEYLQHVLGWLVHSLDHLLPAPLPPGNLHDIHVFLWPVTRDVFLQVRDVSLEPEGVGRSSLAPDEFFDFLFRNCRANKENDR